MGDRQISMLQDFLIHMYKIPLIVYRFNKTEAYCPTFIDTFSKGCMEISLLLMPKPMGVGRLNLSAMLRKCPHEFMPSVEPQFRASGFPCLHANYANTTSDYHVTRQGCVSRGIFPWK